MTMAIIVFRTESNIYDEAFLTRIVFAKFSNVDVWLGSKYAFDDHKDQMNI